MSKIELKDYQKEAIKLAVNVPLNMVCCQTGTGKSVISTFYTRYLINKKLTDKVILCSTKTGCNSFHKAFGKRVGVEVPQYDELEDVLNFFTNNERVMIMKHSMIEKLGFTQANIDFIRNALTNNYKRITIIIDEGHKLSNPEAILHQAFQNIRFAFERISVQTATPYGSSLSSLYGLVCLIYPKLWRSKRAFYDDHIEEKVIIDYKTKKVRRKEEVAYRNLDMLRKKLEPFAYFYYPELDLNFIEHKTRLKDYTEYDNICMGVVPEEELK